MDVPAQNEVEPPVIAAGTGETVNTAVDVPDVPINVMVAVPAETPVTRPSVSIVATDVLLLDQVPGPIIPVVEESKSRLVEPTQAPKVP